MVKRRVFSVIASMIALSSASLFAFAAPASANVPAASHSYYIVDQAHPGWQLSINSQGELVDSSLNETTFVYTQNGTMRVDGSNNCVAWNSLGYYDLISCNNVVASDTLKFLSGNAYTVMTTDYQYSKNPANCMFGPTANGGQVYGTTCDASSDFDRWQWISE